MGKVLKYIDDVSMWSGKIIAWLILPLTAIMAYDLILRKFYQATIWVFDTTLWLYSAFFLIGCAWVQMERSQIRVDVIYEKYSPLAKAIFEILTYLILYFPVILICAVSASQYAWESFKANEISIYSPWAPPLWPIKAIAPVAFLLLLLQGIGDFIKYLKTVLKGGGGHDES